ncbi:hypothetical protein HPB49_012423 [Dermacentor silvarum]|uniref:Uncharacterized protein n=1 Tax=Dermacentor silvarum TaxID=543639 RepID=A0ACB8DPE5_DERSI|nr:hypothetical protein HPB49_012423 [Dermacentor silvarum]
MPLPEQLLETRQFNGCFGCPWCLACGTLQEGRRLFINSEPTAPERTAAGIRRDMKLAMELQTPVNGLKGPSAFWPLQYLDLVECYTVEYRHCVLLGVTRQFTEYRFDSSHCHEKFYIGRPSTLNFLNRRLKGIQPPHHITRLPRSIQERHFWKAHEWRNWLLYYCLPCCQNTLPSPYMKPFAILSEAIFLLLQEQLSPTAIAQEGSQDGADEPGYWYWDDAGRPPAEPETNAAQVPATTASRALVHGPTGKEAAVKKQQLQAFLCQLATSSSQRQTAVSLEMAARLT